MVQSDGSVSQWIVRLKTGDESATARLWKRYYGRLIGLARKKLGAALRRVADEDDVAISAFQSFCQKAKEDRFPDLRDRDDLWHLIVHITEGKARDQWRDQARKKRGSGLVAGESAFADLDASNPGAGINAVAGPQPTPELVAEMIEAVDRLFTQLADDELRQIAQHKLEGYTNEEIAKKIGRALPTIERRLRLIRSRWQREISNA